MCTCTYDNTVYSCRWCILIAGQYYHNHYIGGPEVHYITHIIIYTYTSSVHSTLCSIPTMCLYCTWFTFTPTMIITVIIQYVYVVRILYFSVSLLQRISRYFVYYTYIYITTTCTVTIPVAVLRPPRFSDEWNAVEHRSSTVHIGL